MEANPIHVAPKTIDTRIAEPTRRVGGQRYAAHARARGNYVDNSAPNAGLWPRNGFSTAQRRPRGGETRVQRAIRARSAVAPPPDAGFRLSEDTTCFVSTEYFDDNEPFSDFVVHEAAHVFHNCKRRTIGLPAPPGGEWLLDIEYRKREVFAYSCEVYARILEQSTSPSERIALADRYDECKENLDERADPREVAAIVREACAARAGWKVLLSRCSPPHRRYRERKAVSGSHRAR